MSADVVDDTLESSPNNAYMIDESIHSLAIYLAGILEEVKQTDTGVHPTWAVVENNPVYS